jgi:hypothetical protein
MRKLPFIAILLLASASSCKYYDNQVPQKEVLLEKELQAINWNEVDEYPSIPECEKLEDPTLRQQCFFEYLTQLIQQKLSIDTLSVMYPELDTIDVTVTVFPDSSVVFDPQVPIDSVGYDKVMIDSILRERLSDFPKISPALKRGIPVKTQFVLPVIIDVQ